MDNLNELRSKIEAIAEQCGLVVFPSMPTTSEHTLIADWPGEDWEAFVSLGARMSCGLLYVDSTTVDEDTVAGVELALAGAAEFYEEPHGMPDDADPLGEEVNRLKALVTEARRRVEDVGVVELGYAQNSVLHRWRIEAPWFAAIDEAAFTAHMAADGLIDSPWDRGESRWEVRARAEQELVSLEPRIVEWTEALLESSAFLGGTSREMRTIAAREVVPTLSDWLALPYDTLDATASAHRSAAHDVISRAEQRIQAVKHERASSALQRENALVDQLLLDPNFNDLNTVEERKRHIRAFVQAEIGFQSPPVTDRLLALVRRRIQR